MNMKQEHEIVLHKPGFDGAHAVRSFLRICSFQHGESHRRLHYVRLPLLPSAGASGNSDERAASSEPDAVTTPTLTPRSSPVA